jgi:hypothetical protein
MAFPVATQTTAFLSGASLAALAVCLDVLKSRGLLRYNADDPQLFPLIAAYFFVTVIVFVIGIRNLAPAELKTRVPLLYFPTTRAGWALLFNCWGRMLAWFLGAASVAAIVASAHYLSR